MKTALIIPKYRVQGLKVITDSAEETPLQSFRKNGYVVVKNLYNTEDLHNPPPDMKRGYWQMLPGKTEPEYNENQGAGVHGSLEKYNFPELREVHQDIKSIVEHIFDDELYTTYCFERYYFRGQELKRHIDRRACEVSVSLQIGHNSAVQWPFEIEDLNGNPVQLTLNNNDAVIYMGCLVPHWRQPLKSRYNKLGRGINKLRRKEDDSYWQQAFFHYVRANGENSHMASDCHAGVTGIM